MHTKNAKATHLHVVWAWNTVRKGQSICGIRKLLQSSWSFGPQTARIAKLLSVGLAVAVGVFDTQLLPVEIVPEIKSKLV